mgnify:CR=1 FL=1
MKIDDQGLEIDTIYNIIDKMENELKSLYGINFTIRPEGVIDNLASTFATLTQKIQTQIATLSREFDPESAADKYQDALYERIGVTRLEAQKSTFVLKVQGAANLVCNAHSMTIRSKSDNNEFENISEFTTDSDGIALVDFQCVIDGAIEVKSTDEFLIVTAPDGITSVSQSDDLQFSIGRERESDNEFRIRFRNSKALNAKATRNANLANLSKYVDNIAFLKIVDKKSDENFDAGTVKIIAYHNTTDNIFAEAIFNTIADGIELLGDTQITVRDASDEPVVIKFKNADEIELSITAEVKVRSGYYANTVFNKVKENILKYIDERVFGLESIVYATEFIIPILETDGVEAVQSIKVKRNGIDEDYQDNVSLTREQVPIFATERIVLNENE